ncbi:MAG: Lrp/AsnC ligand binding domain-containing protein [Chloroflexi bacterium]|nr:Lrp/AsnC ligand binding domain-containing protein [Chloroflexota bacterium]
MATKAYVLLTTEPAKTKAIIAKMTKVPGVREANEVLGPYDVVLELEIERLEEMTDILRKSIRPVDGVLSTLTCVTMKPV